MRWECRHASAEVLYLEVRRDGVYSYFNHSPEQAEVWDFAAVLAGEYDHKIQMLFGDTTLTALKLMVGKRSA